MTQKYQDISHDRLEHLWILGPSPGVLKLTLKDTEG